MSFRAPIKVRFADIDHAGIVYYPHFMHYFHLAMEEFFPAILGIDYSAVMHERNCAFPTVHVECDFKRRMEYGNQIDIEVSILKIGQSSITWGYRGCLHNDEEVTVVEGSNVTVCVRTDTFEKIGVPDWLRNGLTAYINSCV